MTRVLVVLPFLSGGERRHATADTVEPLLAELSKVVDLELYVPGLRHEGHLPKTLQDRPIRLWGSKLERPEAWMPHVRLRPAALAGTWGRNAEKEAQTTIARSSPDVVQLEYLHTLRLAARLRRPSVYVVHDNAADVMREQYQASSGVERQYRRIEWLRTRLYERKTRHVRGEVLGVSQSALVGLGRRGEESSVVRYGVQSDGRLWNAPGNPTPTYGFVGAMWRPANVQAADMLITRVMPEIWRLQPSACLRIVGSAPDDTLLQSGDNRIVVTGEVADLDSECLRVDALLLPSVVSAGTLMKVHRALALGVPFVTNTKGTAGLEEFEREVPIAETPEAMAAQAVELTTHPNYWKAHFRAASARYLASHRWSFAVETYVQAYARAMA